MKSVFNRHTLVWIRPESRASVAAQITDGALHAHVAAWLTADRPLVVARQACRKISTDTVAAGKIAMGLVLPPAQGKRRIALKVAAQDVSGHSQPLLLADALGHAPIEWRTALAELDAAARNIEIDLRVFGSLAWQALSGLSYLTPQSDVDLLWHPQSNTQLQQGITLLMRWERSSGLRADGEVLFGESSAVSWREWATLKPDDARRVLVKRESRAELVDRRELLETLA